LRFSTTCDILANERSDFLIGGDENLKDFKLKLEVIEIKGVRFGAQTMVENGTVHINKSEMIEYLKDPAFSRIDIDLAMPGDSTRIIPVKDVIEPRIKIDEGSGAFPGFFGEFEGCGEGRTKVLRGCSVVTVGAIVGFQEGIIDMSGLGAQYSPYSSLNNVVLIIEPIEGLHPSKHEDAVRTAGIKAAYYLAQAAKDVPHDYTEEYELEQTKTSLPKVAVIYMLIAQGLLHDNYFYGADAKKVLPTIVHPNEIFDGALVNGTCVVAGDKSTTYDHQNNPLLHALYKRHGKDLDFRGVVLAPTYPGLADKKRSCHIAVNLARILDVDGVIIHEEGGGNPEADLMMIIRGCERHGIKTVAIVGPDGVEEPIADTTPEADAVIDAGDANEMVILPKMEKIIGHPEQVKVLSGGSEGSMLEDGSLAVTLSIITSATNGLGSKMTSYVY
jgi:glycine reductase